jgi:hypothetical protein
MKRLALTTLGIAGLAVSAPGNALAHGHHHRHGHRHGGVRVEDFGPQASGPSTSTLAPTPAGTVLSFTNNVLTIKLADGAQATGVVTPDTRIECVALAEPSPMTATSSSTRDDSHDGDDDPAPGTTSGHSGDSASTDQDDGQPGCGVGALTPNAVVEHARLSFTGAGAVWDKVEIDS